jgi:hypothetical protein
MENKLQEVQDLIYAIKEGRGSISDGYHTFDELYEFRKVYNALLFNEWAKQITEIKEWAKDEQGRLYAKVVTRKYKYDIHKSICHNNGELCFGGGWFVVIAILPSGQITNHYEMKDWGLFKIPELEKAKYQFDGHTSEDVVERMLNLLSK